MKNRKLLFIVLLVLFLIGLAIFLYPVIQQARIDKQSSQAIQQFLADRPERTQTKPMPSGRGFTTRSWKKEDTL